MKKAVMLIFCLICVFILSATAFAGDVNLSVAASLKEVVNELADNFARKNPDVKFLSIGRPCQADRERRARRHLHLCQPGVDGLPEKQAAGGPAEHRHIHL